MKPSFYVYSRGKKMEGTVAAGLLNAEEVGIFESLRTYRRKIFRCEDHLKRFLESARTIGMARGLDRAKLRREMESALEAFFSETGSTEENIFIRLTVWRGEPVVMIGQRKHAEKIYREGVRLKTSPVKRTLSNAAPAEIKTTAYQNAAFASLEPGGEYEWVFLDAHGFLTEVRVGNLFILKDGLLLTPPTTGILNGVTRKFVIECARKIKIPVKQIPLSRHDVYNADEAFLTNTSWEILPVQALDGRSIGQDIPGSITSRLQHVFKERVKKECR